MTNIIFDKSDKGREEISTRKYHLTPKLRAMLVLVDGKHTADDLHERFSSIGLTEDILNDLCKEGFIQHVEPAAFDKVPLPDSSAAIATGMQEEPKAIEGILRADENQFQALYNFYSHTIKSTAGLRGYTLQLKVEHAGSVEELRALRTPYLELVLKAKGEEIARTLRGRLDQLLFPDKKPASNSSFQEAAQS